MNGETLWLKHYDNGLPEGFYIAYVSHHDVSGYYKFQAISEQGTWGMEKISKDRDQLIKDAEAWFRNEWVVGVYRHYYKSDYNHNNSIDIIHEI